MIEPVKAARVVQTYSTIGNCTLRTAVRPNTAVRDSVRLSEEALKKFQDMKSACQESEKTADSSAQDSRKSLDLLNLAPNATAAEIRKAYISAINKYHPDKYTGLPQEFRELAEEKTKEINVAYHRLMTV
jgi:DnaJ-domain-containing protein 1